MGKGLLDPLCIAHFEEGRQLMNEQKYKKKKKTDNLKTKMSPLLAHIPYHTPFCGIFSNTNHIIEIKGNVCVKA